eukprot:CAMPEP_0182926222 /NCGR_PEP_ID=MMETSP0105_2-20130417/11239_1 /TAXON_ID=81532 ORGANISM="Acanthoeca-like sp., Strain 10tr" /NCGR_SAMPLE_ID=MMETSP0105_2 /ASSEMBLY_ACC=CAM_ASM_000205 /LENGTH=307 /DNA_ID=CAMNT_0025064103 /DNA_START=64 /DNA_END=987 /DNA_ORIENTATION=+
MVKSWGEEVAGVEDGAAAPAPPDKSEKKKGNELKVIELEGGELPPPVASINGNIKTVVTYTRKEDTDVIEKRTRTYLLEDRKVKVSKSVMERRTWPKFGVAKDLPPGPDTASTNVVVDEVYLQLSSNKKLQDDAEDSGDKTIANIRAALAKRALKMQSGEGSSSARIGGDDGGRIASGVYVAPANRKRAEEGGEGGPAGKGAYVPPSMRPGRSGGGDSMYQRDDQHTLRVSNISENAREDDLRELFRPFGPISRCYLAMDKMTGLARGFAYINYLRREDAEKAIDALNRHAYDHLILQVEWAEERKD